MAPNTTGEVVTPRELNQRVKYLFRMYTPELPEPVMMCSWVWTKSLPDGGEEFRCSQCGSVQVREQLVGGGKEQVLSNMSDPLHPPHPLAPYFDFRETIMRGHAIGGAPGASHQMRVARTPTWALIDKQVQELLRKVFPKMDSDRNQRERALRWVRIIYQFFREGRSANHIALDICADAAKLNHMDMDKACWERQRRLVKKAIYRIKKAAAGLRTTGKPRTRKPKKERPRTGRPRGRPKKERDVSF